MGFFISDAIAQTANAPASMETTSSLLMMVGIFVVFYLLIIRPQSKRAKEQREIMKKVKAGDEIATTSGIVGEIVQLDDQFMTLNVQKDVNIVIQRQAIASVLPKGTLSTLKKS